MEDLDNDLHSNCRDYTLSDTKGVSHQVERHLLLCENMIWETLPQGYANVLVHPISVSNDFPG